MYDFLQIVPIDNHLYCIMFFLNVTSTLKILPLPNNVLNDLSGHGGIREAG
jgi:hypothetical protein